MSEEQKEQPTGELQKQDSSLSRSAKDQDVLRLATGREISLVGLNEDQIAELRFKYADMIIDAEKAAHQASKDVKTLDDTLETFTRNTNEATQHGTSVTVTHAKDDSLGRTEVIMGNTDTAARGKLTRSQKGGFGCSWIVVISFVVVIGALIIAL